MHISKIFSKFSVLFFSCIIASSIFVRADSSQNTNLCPQIVFEGKLDPPFTDVEKNLICGTSDKTTLQKAWSKIPFNQAKYNLTNFLQERGYHHPSFIQGTSPSSQHKVILGEKTLVKEIVLEGDPKVDPKKKRKILNEPLTPSLLDTLERWATAQLEEQGYGCPVVKTRADPDTGEVFLNIQTGPLTYVASVLQEPIAGLHDDILRRYDAFEIHQPFNGKLLDVTADRSHSEKIIESTRFVKTCQGDQLSLRQTAVAGQPRLITVGVGLNTEGLVLGKFSWTNTRWGEMGSRLSFLTEASARLQTAEAELNWYFLPYVSRYSITPAVQFARRDETHFELLTAKAQIGVTRTFDWSIFSAKAFLGPSMDLTRTLRGPGSSSSQLLSIEARGFLQHHDFEYYRASPQSGFKLNFLSNFTTKSLVSSVTAQKLTLKGESLWNIAQLDPPLLVFGVRGGISTTLIQESDRANLPANYLHYLGGSSDLRGFGRQELSLNSGGLTSAFLGIEARLVQVLPLHLEPFIFTDGGMMGQVSASFNSPLYWGPGVGIRWDSPIGPVRFTAAHGFINNNPGHMQFFLGFGEEF